VSPHVSVFGEIGRLSNALPGAEHDAIRNAAMSMADRATLVPVILGRVPVGYGMAGLRAKGMAYGRFTPFVEAGYGVAHLNNELNVSLDGVDISPQVLTTPVASLSSEWDQTLTVGGGATIGFARRTGLDLGYRYSRIFASSQAINSGNVYAAVRVGF
jgi:opacity protein-like surface antigen